MSLMKLSNFYKPLLGNARRKGSVNSEYQAKVDEENKKEHADSQVLRKISEDIDLNYNFDHPDSIDWELLLKGLEQLKSGKPFNMP